MCLCVSNVNALIDTSQAVNYFATPQSIPIMRTYLIYCVCCEQKPKISTILLIRQCDCAIVVFVVLCCVVTIFYSWYSSVFSVSQLLLLLLLLPLPLLSLRIFLFSFFSDSLLIICNTILTVNTMDQKFYF